MNHNLEKLSSIGFFDIKPGLERITEVFTYLGNPQDKIESVLIAGTNGKGSVAAILSNILIQNDYKTGLYTSPHLISVTERLRINGNDITETIFDSILGEIFNACSATHTELSYFELVTVTAFLYFEKEKVDIAVLEVGMGGRWDATNVVTPLVSIITNISLDHTEHLGETTDLIAAEKAEIIKDKIPAVSGVMGKECKVLEEKAASTNSKIYFIEKDFNYSFNEDNTFNYSGINKKINNLSTNLFGKHQVTNSTIALATAELLHLNYDFNLDFDDINKPLKSVSYEGRFEILKTDPYLILDAAHNTASAKALVSSINDLKEDKFVFLISMLSDKDHGEFISTISNIAEKIIITKIPNERSTETKLLYKVTKQYMDNIEVIEDYKEAYQYVTKLNTPVCITGSVYLVGLIKEIVKQGN